MKQLFVLIVIAMIGYWLYSYYQQNPEALPALHRALAPAVTPTPTGATDAPTPRPVQPRLDSVPVSRGETLTHAKVKNFTSVGVLFMADQGIFEIPYDRLPPSFAAYYVPLVPKPTPTPEGITPTPTPTPTHAKRPPARTAEEDARAQREYDANVKMMQDRIVQYQDVIDKYHTQSSFEPSISEGTYNDAVVQLAKAQALLNDLYSRGPQ